MYFPTIHDKVKLKVFFCIFYRKFKAHLDRLFGVVAMPLRCDAETISLASSLQN